MAADPRPPSTASGGWTWEHVTGPLEDLVAAAVPDPARRLVRVIDPRNVAFVLGSTQPRPTTSLRTVRRRTGGGGVLVAPGALVWVDLVVPRDDPWWDDDVGRAAHPVGEAWATALRALGLDAEVHRGALTTTPWSRTLCFAGLGPGEVRVHGRKAVGVAQRRVRAGACFQCAVPLRPPGRATVDAAGLTGAEAEAAAAALDRSVVPVERPGEEILAALAAVLTGP